MFRLLRHFLLWAFAAGLLLAGLAAGAIYLYVVPKLPSTESLKDVRMQVPLRVYSADGKLMAEYGEMKRQPVPYRALPKPLIQAFLAAEDDRFFEHPGVDYQGLLRAAMQLVLTGQRAQGGSTITMQVVRNFFLSPEKTYSRKLNEILLALRIERELTKEEVLELYLNKIYLGNRAYGVAAAAQVYYGKELADLNLAQMAMIAGLPKAPSKYNPIADPERTLQRRDYVLGRLHALGWISDEQHQQALAQPETATLHGVAIELDAPYGAEMVRAEMVNRFGQDAYTKGFRVRTTLDAGLQQAAEQAVRGNLYAYEERHGYRGPEQRGKLGGDDADAPKVLQEVERVAELSPSLVLEVEPRRATIYIKGMGREVLEWEGMEWARPYLGEDSRGGKPKQASEVLRRGDLIRVRPQPGAEGKASWRLSQLPQVESALVALDPRDGGIKALVGGYDFYSSKFNRVTQAKRQPGSGFKAVIYSAALEAGFTPSTVINDAPVVVEAGQRSQGWRPENFGGKFYGPTRMREALAKSRNMVSIRLLQDIGISNALKYAERFGFDGKLLPGNLTLALGTGEVVPLDMARAYAVLANGGFLVQPYFIERIEEEGQGVVFQASPAKACPECDEAAKDQPLAPRTLTPQNAYLMNSMLRDVIQRGTATDAKKLGRKDLAGKTGTTNQQHDAWFNGFHPELVAVVWVGFDDSRPMGKDETGGKAALPAWMEFMRVALPGLPERPLALPAGMFLQKIDPQSGQPAAEGQRNAIEEAFRAGDAQQPASGDGAMAPGEAAALPRGPAESTEGLF